MRLAVTDRCNLRCSYCMPEEGINFLEKSAILSYEEMLRLISILNEMGLNKIRITGGEPFVRKDLIYFLQEVKRRFKLESFNITSNATLLHLYMNEIPALFSTMNISLDSLNKERFFEITRRDSFDIVIENINELIERGIKVKVNAVVMNGKNIEDLIPFVKWTKDKDIAVRFIEEMPFNGSGKNKPELLWDYRKILSHIATEFKDIQTLASPLSSTAMRYQVKGFKGEFGIIPAFSRTFCGTCNRIRITAKGELRTCLYSANGTDLLNPLRKTTDDAEIAKLIVEAVSNKEKDGFEAVNNKQKFIYESMTSIGG